MSVSLSRDTDPAFEQVWIRALRDRGGQASLERCVRMSGAARREAWRAIRRARPELSPEDQDLLFLEVQYGDQFTERQRREIIRLRGVRGIYDSEAP